jgi:hypothetical protein
MLVPRAIPTLLAADRFSDVFVAELHCTEELHEVKAVLW